MSDEEFTQMLQLLKKFGQESMDQHDHFRFPLGDGHNTLYVGIALAPDPAGYETAYRLMDVETGKEIDPNAI